MSNAPNHDPSVVAIDYSQIVSDLVARATQNLADSLLKQGAKQLDNFRLRLGSTFTRYLDSSLRLRSQVKTILYRTEPQPIYDFYVPQDVSSAHTSLFNVSIRSLLEETSRVIITGTGGSGKSMLMRHLFIDTMRSTDYVPLFIELRSVNENGTTVADLIDREVDLGDINLPPDAIRRGFDKKTFLLILDGLDEVIPAKRDAVAKEIRDLARKYDKLPIVISSRPDERFVGWEAFTEYKVQPLTLDKIRDLLAKLRYDEGAKVRFLADIEASLFETHRSFLSNPLLLTLMLLSYSFHASVPSKRHQFYGEIFETMWSQHDASKDGFKRYRLTSVDKDDYIRILEAFAFQTYLDSAISFDRHKAAEYLDKSKQIQQINFESEGFLDDLIKNVCILVVDGVNLTYTHRSFQEYYAARFVRFLKPGVREKMMAAVAARGQQDAVLDLLWEMAPELVERELFIPVLKTFQPVADATDEDAARFEMFSMLVQAADVTGDRVYLLGNQLEITVARFVLEKYSPQDELVKATMAESRRADEASQDAAKQIGGISKALRKDDFAKFKEPLLVAARPIGLLEPAVAHRLLSIARDLEIKDQQRTDSVEMLLKQPRQPLF